MIKIYTDQLKKLPQESGVYLFKNDKNEILYIGKAKNLKKRISSYFKNNDTKIKLLLSESIKIDFIKTKNELEAMLLEAKLIKNNQPKFNISLKSGQPFIYIMITNRMPPELKIVRNKKQKGTFFGPFIEKTYARKVFSFLEKTFRLRLCKHKIDNGCLYYHIGICAGNCKKNFEMKRYLERLNLAKKLLKHGHKKFLQHLKLQIKKHNQNMEFEKSRELNGYLSAFKSVFISLETDISKNKLSNLITKHIWILSTNKKTLFLFRENEIKLKNENIFPVKNNIIEQMQNYYKTYPTPDTILVNFEIEKNQKKLTEQFLKKWNNKSEITILKPSSGHFENLIKLAQIKAEQEIKNRKNLANSLKNFLKLNYEINTIDCFDISHKQGMFMVGSCIRFKDGHPDKKNFRHFKIKTIVGQNDYASLKEIVERRYIALEKAKSSKPNLVLIDGGKGQLNAVKNLFPEIEFAALTKSNEIIFSNNLPNGKKLNPKDIVGQTLISLRDYAHHFAISYHKKLELIKNRPE